MTGTGSGGDAQGDRLLNIENLVGSNFDDTLEGSTVSGSLDGGLGNDTVSFAHAASGAGGAGVTVNLALTTWQNTITGGWHQLLNIENVTGSEFSDTLIGNFGNDIITGLVGNDTLNGNWGADTMFGGTGNDIYGLTMLATLSTRPAATARTRFSRGSASALPIRCMPLARSRI